MRSAVPVARATSERWPGLHLLTPNWMNRLPGPWPEADPDGFMSAASFGERLSAYRKAIAAPVLLLFDSMSLK